jgi:two-component system, sporulation sensor kinase D
MIVYTGNAFNAILFSAAKGTNYMFFEKEQYFLSQNKECIILKWFELLDKRIPGIYRFMDWETDANQFFLLMTEFDIPADIHPYLNQTSISMESSDQLNVTIDHLLISAQCWCDSFFNVLSRYDNPESALECSEILISRHNIFLRKISELYLQNSIRTIKEKDIKIDKLHLDRLNIIGKMASSMAHEIRNPLTSIGGFLKLIRNNINSGNHAQLIKYIDIIDDEFFMINMQITGFLSFSKNSMIEEKNKEISALQIIEDTLTLLNPRLINDNIEIQFSDESNSIICVQKIAIQQVISNIISNAIEALNTIDYPKKIKILSSRDDENTYIKIINNGPKIAAELRESLFDPFISDKEEGTGLGLAICKEIMTKNNGRIDFISDDNETTFILSFSNQPTMF